MLKHCLSFFSTVVRAGFALGSLLLAVESSALQGTVLTPLTLTAPAGNTIRFSLYLPPGYNGGTARYPVIFHLHGANGTHDGTQIASVPASHETAVAAGRIEPSIIVFPDGYTNTLWANSATSAKPAENDVLALIAHIDATYRTRAGRAARAIEGFSMGGFGAAKFAAKYPDLFCACVMYDAALLDWSETQQQQPGAAKEIFNNDSAYYDQYSPWYWTPRNAATLRASLPFRQVVGVIRAGNQSYQALLQANGIVPSYVQTTAPHVVENLLEQGGAESWAFIGAAFGQAPTVPTPPVLTRPSAATPKTFVAASGLYGALPPDTSASDAMVATFLSRADFAGVSVRVFWREVEPAKGAYDWAYLDSVVAAAQAKGKRALLRIEAAWASPQWVLDAVQANGGALYEYFEKNQVTAPDAKERMPAPWDATYLAYWRTFVAALGARYNGQAGVAGALVTGGGRAAEMSLPVPLTDGGPDWKASPYHYTAAKLTTAWEGVIDAFAAAFPDKPVGLPLTLALEDDGVVQAVAAYAAVEYPWRVQVKNPRWANANDPAFLPTATFAALADEYTHGGLEPAGAAPADATNAAVDAALAWHALGMIEVPLAQLDNFNRLKAAIDARRDMIEKISFSTEPGAASAQLAWTIGAPNPYSQGIVIYRRSDDFPAGTGDAKATLVFDGNGTGSRTDTGLTSQTKYYYSVYDKATGYTLAQGTATPSPATTPPPSTPPNQPASSGGGGGGGAPSVFGALAVATLAALRARKTARSAAG